MRALTGEKRKLALSLAAELIDAARAHVGRTRDEVQQALSLDVAAKDRKLCLGLKKLLEDRCLFDEGCGVDAALLRQEVFTRAAAKRLRLPDGSRLERASVVEEIARERGLTAEALDAALFADLKGAHRLLKVDVSGAEEIADRYDLARAQAVLLRAVRVTARVGGSDPDGYRALFRRLKFLRLLYRVDVDDDGYRLEIDGPAALFSSATRYGLELALVLPALAALPRCSVEADVQWGKKRVARRFLWSPEDARLPRRDDDVPPRDEVTRLLEGLRRLSSPWRAHPSTELLPLAGAGVCVPDLTFVHDDTGDVVHLEVLGYWSRDAVWRRIELVEAGLVDRVVFAASARLRVSERALDDEGPAALYIYKGVMSARGVVDKVDALARRR